MPKPLLSIKDLKMHFPIHGGLFKKQIAKVHAVDGVDLELYSGETLGLVGESGCGKSTLGRTILKLYKATQGKIHFDGQEISHLDPKEMRPVRSQLQVVFQDPYESLNSRHTIGRILEEPLIIHNFQHSFKNNKEYILDLLKKVGLPTSAYERYPHEFSGGQRQRIGIARAIALRPKLIICDEPVSALDVSIQSQIMNLLMDLQEEMNLAFLFIAHDLAVVRHISDRIAVMYLGRIVEICDAEELYTRPLHPYTKALISAIPVPDPTIKKQHTILKGDVPSPISPPSGCAFHTRCPHASEKCRTKSPELRSINGDQHLASCHFAEELLSTN
jgi:peptide/nickel transport system ATP-binding protein